ncbi:MAG: lytic transglycosylase domain-containing protein [Bacteroidales bacterium]|nr:lytic transglycosylase domain-containing protein [Bacteroidales bacterium]MDZ4204529.1 lytic transglycosylase domain-containing protein [Bacteroidales bacterium]
MFRKSFIILSILIALITIHLLISWSSITQSSDKAFKQAFLKHNKVFPVEIPAKVIFADESVPLDKYYVYEALDRELTINTYWHSNSILWMKRANRWFPLIEPILKLYNIPNDFKYLAVIESGLTNTVSPAGAAGFWQLMDKTAKELGLEVDNQVDERYHVVKATHAACKYLNESYKIYGSWFMSAAAYNAGKDRIVRAIGDQKTNDYFDLYLNEETSRFIYRLLAVKTIFEAPANYGFYLRKKDLYQPVPTFTVSADSSISNLTDYALYHNINYRLLKEFNPWLMDNKLHNPSRKTYTFIIPQTGFMSRQKLLEQLAHPDLLLNDTISAGQLFE